MVGSDEAAPSGLQPDGLGPNTISPAQSRAARALLNWSEADLAGKLGLGEDFVRDFESGDATLRPGSSRLCAAP